MVKEVNQTCLINMLHFRNRLVERCKTRFSKKLPGKCSRFFSQLGAIRGQQRDFGVLSHGFAMKRRASGSFCILSSSMNQTELATVHDRKISYLMCLCVRV